MKLNLDEIHYRIRTDNEFKKKLRKLVLIGGVGIMLIAVLGVLGIGFLFANAPGLFEISSIMSVILQAHLWCKIIHLF